MNDQAIEILLVEDNLSDKGPEYLHLVCRCSGSFFNL